MLFTPNLKRKRGSNNKCIIKPFPYTGNKRCEGVFTGISVEVWETSDIVALYDNGFYGKGSQSRSVPKIVHNASSSTSSKDEMEESLILGLEEAFFLAYYVNVLKINDTEKNEIEYEKFFRYCLIVNAHFIETLASYLYLKSRGWVIKSGLKFGGNYLIYRKGPRFYHASFVVIISSLADTDYMRSKNFKGLQRIAETSDKDVLILEVHKPRGFVFQSLVTISNVEISEMVIRRFNYTSYVQNKNLAK